jgi:hypothetical protein
VGAVVKTERPAPALTRGGGLRSEGACHHRGGDTYLLLLRLATPLDLVVGRLGRLELRAGWHLYSGSALAGLRARLRRHARWAKPRHWHVDTLREVTELVAVAVRALYPPHSWQQLGQSRNGTERERRPRTVRYGCHI